MKTLYTKTCLTRLTHLVLVLVVAPVYAWTDPLPSWNGGPAKTAIIEFVKKTTEKGPSFVPPEPRIATFDHDGTTWVEQPLPTHLVYALERLPAVVEKKPELKNVEPFKTVLSDRKSVV